MKYDWTKLEREFTCYAKYAACSLREFARIKGIPYGANFRKHSQVWIDKRGSKKTQKSIKIEAILEAKEISREVATVERHFAVWDKFINIVEQSITDKEKLEKISGEDSPYKVINGLAKVMDKASKGQRVALNLDKLNEKQAEEKLSEMLEKMTEAFSDD